MDPDALESVFSGFETNLAEALVRIDQARNLENEEDRSYLLTLIALTAMRSPTLRANIRVVASDLGRMGIAARLRDGATYDASILEAKTQGAIPQDYDVGYEEMKAAFEDGDFKLALDDNELISIELQLLEHITPLLQQARLASAASAEGLGRLHHLRPSLLPHMVGSSPARWSPCARTGVARHRHLFSDLALARSRGRVRCREYG